MDDKRHLYNKAKILLNQANEAFRNKEWYAYRTYVDGYNELVELTAKICGDEVYRYMSPIKLPSSAFVSIENAPSYMSTAVNKLRELMAYLQVEKQK
jgi:hypothetical protein